MAFESAPGRRLSLRTAIVLAIFVLVALFPLANPPRYFVTVLTEVLIWSIFAMSLDLLLGYTGLPSLGHSAFWATGAYTAGIVAMNVSPSLLVAVPIGMLAAGVLALVIGAVSVRLAGVYFLMVTLAFTQVVFGAAFKWTWLTGGSNGLAGIPRFQVPGLNLADGTTYYYVCLLMAGATLLLLRLITLSPLGRTFIGIRENESRMRALGYNTYRYKLASFVIAGVVAGLAGGLIAGYNGYVSPVDANWSTSGTVMVMVIVGGVGTLFGPVLGAALELLLKNWVSSLPAVGDRWQFIMGFVFVSFVLFARGGIVGVFESAMRRAGPGSSSRPRAAATAEPAAVEATA